MSGAGSGEEGRHRVAGLHTLASPCRLCPRRCGAERTKGEIGFCGAGAKTLVASAGAHFGEERCLVGRGGSGTLFLGGCNLGCLFCQNHDISHGRGGVPAGPDDLAAAMLELAAAGCENINWVTPTHVVHHLAEALDLARRRGLALPLVYNCGGYESVEILRLLDGVVDIYMPDAKTLDPAFAAVALQALDYPEVLVPALEEMQRQVGDLEIDVDGVARRGLLVRHLVMPGGDAAAVLHLLAERISPRCAVNVMGQYHPEYRAAALPELDRVPTVTEVRAAQALARELGLRPV